MQQDVMTISQEDIVILKGKKCEGLYKLKKENLVRGGVLGISLEGRSSRGGASRKTATGYELGQSVAKGEMVHSSMTQDDENHCGKSAKGPEKRGQELKVSRHGYNQEKHIKILIQNLKVFC